MLTETRPTSVSVRLLCGVDTNVRASRTPSAGKAADDASKPRQNCAGT